jgi:hypothetical protein|tara:strand:+ start:642 stop:824 length:183 start_codon:yes stop_codon:yes gene_type:complete
MEDRNKTINKTNWKEATVENMEGILKQAEKLGWSTKELLTIRDMIIEIRWTREHILSQKK